MITGSTGVGKTDFSLQLGNTLPIEIVNADLGQFYEPLTIGTAKPAWKNEKIKHHLFDIFSEPYSCTVMEYRLMLKNSLREIWSRGAIPVIVGGSTFYIESIFFEPSCIAQGNDASFIPDQQATWQALENVDPQRASEIHPNDHYRIKRALEIWKRSGIKPSLQKSSFKPLAPFFFYKITRDREDLYNRINQRVMSMFDQGWIEEVSSLMMTRWHDFVLMKKFIGYPDIGDYILQGLPENKRTHLIESIAQKTRNYAKRQETYWRRLEKKIYNCLVTAHGYTYVNRAFIREVNLTYGDLAVYSNQQAKLIRNFSESGCL